MFATVLSRADRSVASFTALAIWRSDGPLETCTPGCVDFFFLSPRELLAMKDRLTLSG